MLQHLNHITLNAHDGFTLNNLMCTVCVNQQKTWLVKRLWYPDSPSSTFRQLISAAFSNMKSQKFLKQRTLIMLQKQKNVTSKKCFSF